MAPDSFPSFVCEEAPKIEEALVSVHLTLYDGSRIHCGTEESASPIMRSPSLTPTGHFAKITSKSSDTTMANKNFPSPSECEASQAFFVEHHPLSSLSIAREPDMSIMPLASNALPADGLQRQKDETGFRKSRSIPGMAHQLSHKLSNTFESPTIVHRPSHRARPSVQSLCEQPAPDSHNVEKLNGQSSTDPSSYTNSSGAFVGGGSTGKTSRSSNMASLHGPKNKDRSERLDRILNHRGQTSNQAEAHDGLLTPIVETPHIAAPTIITVETAANAKIFFETYFNALLSTQQSPRSLRRRELETRLHLEALTAEQRERERTYWLLQESDQLRKTRALKSKASPTVGRSGVTAAGFEVVKILGKGSFGVVRLVRQKESTQEDQIAMIPPISITHSWRQTPREDQLNLRGVLRSSLDSQRSPKRNSRSKKDVYAMKVIRKSDMLRNSQEGHLRAERDFLVASEKSRWVVPLIASFQDNTNLYLVMEYMVGGDFLGLLFRKDILKEKKARWYVAEMILCVEEAHRHRWIHRDVKPDNFLISASGHLKISDFGLAFDGHWSHDQSFFNNHRASLMEKLGVKVEGDSLDRKEGASIATSMKLADAVTGRKSRHQSPQTDGPGENEEILHWRNRCGNRRLARSVVGTSQYMAPEVIRGEFYDGRCDWWSIGIILYEVLLPPPSFCCC